MTGEVLDLPLRKRIYQYIQDNPGTHFRELRRELGLPIGHLEFHLNEMLKRDLIVKEKAFGNARYYVHDRLRYEDRKFMGFLRKEIPRDIILFLLENPGSTPNRILSAFTFTGPNLSYHLRRMEKADVLICRSEGRERYYYVKDPAVARDLLVTYNSSLFERIVDRAF